MKTNKINPKELTGETLFYYMTNDYPDKDYSSIVEMLPLTVGDINKAYDILERSIQENKVLSVVYPGNNEQATAGMEYIGDVMDGILYLK